MVQKEIKETADIHTALKAFMDEWHNGQATVQVQTSGSTGTPKQMQVEKRRMENSARLTCSFLGLKQGDKIVIEGVQALSDGQAITPITPAEKEAAYQKALQDQRDGNIQTAFQ